MASRHRHQQHQPAPAPLDVGPAPASTDGPVTVRATQLGIYQNQRRRPGDVFVVADRRDVSSVWMVEIGAAAEPAITSREAQRQEHRTILSRATPPKVDEPAGEQPTGSTDVLGS